MENWTQSELIYEGRIFKVRAGEARLADGVVAPREMVEHPGGVGIVPCLGDRVALIRQYRIAVEETVLEIPAGKLEGCEDPATRARKELAEETGYKAGVLVPAGSIFASVGYTSERIHLFLAFDLEEVGQALEFDERIEPVELPVEGLRRQLARGEIQDAKTAVGLQRLFDYLDRRAG
jgi:ADP-ribose pyrophosphatase